MIATVLKINGKELQKKKIHLNISGSDGSKAEILFLFGLVFLRDSANQ